MDFTNQTKSSRYLVKLVTIALLIALEIVLSRVLAPIQTWNMKFSFGFIAVSTAAFLYGPAAAGITGALSDFLGAVLFPTGAYFPGFTLTSFCTGFIFGMFLKKNKSVKNVVFAVLINQLIFSLIVNTYWITLISGSPFKAVMLSRVPQCIIMGSIMIVINSVLIKQVLPKVTNAISRN